MKNSREFNEILHYAAAPSRSRSRSRSLQFAQINYLQLKQVEYNGNWPQNVRKSLKIKQSRNFVEYLTERRDEGSVGKGGGL